MTQFQGVGQNAGGKHATITLPELSPEAILRPFDDQTKASIFAIGPGSYKACNSREDLGGIMYADASIPLAAPDISRRRVNSKRYNKLSSASRFR